MRTPAYLAVIEGKARTMDEPELIRAATLGDREAFRTLFEEKRDRVYATALHLLGDPEEARDVAQQVFLKVWQRLDQYEPSYRFDTWLYRITVNAAIDAYRRRRARAEAPPLADEEEPGEFRRVPAHPPAQERSLSESEVERVFQQLARLLTLRQRVAFTLRELQGLSTEEVARILRTRQSTVRNHVLQARRILREALRREFPEYMPPRAGGGEAGRP